MYGRGTRYEIFRTLAHLVRGFEPLGRSTFVDYVWECSHVLRLFTQGDA